MAEVYYFLRDYTDEMAGKNAIIEQDANFSENIVQVVHGYLGRFVGVILEGNKFIKIYLSTDMRKKRNGFPHICGFFLDKLV